MSVQSLPPFEPRPRKQPAPRRAPSLDDPAAFRRWLLNNAPGAGIGCGRDACRCPLALWLRVQGARTVHVGTSFYEVGAGSKPLPKWASAFRRDFDQWWSSDDGVATAADCLECLESVLRELGEVASR